MYLYVSACLWLRDWSQEDFWEEERPKFSFWKEEKMQSDKACHREDISEVP